MNVHVIKTSADKRNIQKKQKNTTHSIFFRPKHKSQVTITHFKPLKLYHFIKIVQLNCIVKQP